MKYSSGRDKAQAEISIPFRRRSDARAFLRAMNAEIRTSKTERAVVRFSARDKTLTMRFHAADPVALRPLLNSHLRLVALWKRLSERLDKLM